MNNNIHHFVIVQKYYLIEYKTFIKILADGYSLNLHSESFILYNDLLLN